MSGGDVVPAEECLDQNSFLRKYPVAAAFLAGSFSGTFSTILFQPLDLVKTRLQNPTSAAALINARNGNGMVTIFSAIIQQDQIRGLWRGMVPSLTRCVPGVGLYFCSLDFLKTKYLKNKSPSALQSVALGVCARCMSGALLIPITVVKTRCESGMYGYSSVGSALREIYRIEGLRGMTCGLVPTLFRDAPFSGLYLMFYSQMKVMVPKDIMSQQFATSPINFTCGIFAGILASMVTQPADVLKTKMQLYPNKFNGIWSVVVYVYSQHGMSGYFKGMVPRMLRRTLISAMAWTVYESISKNVGLK